MKVLICKAYRTGNFGDADITDVLEMRVIDEKIVDVQRAMERLLDKHICEIDADVFKKGNIKYTSCEDYIDASHEYKGFPSYFCYSVTVTAVSMVEEEAGVYVERGDINV